jgi:hypothetical protein
MSPKHKENLAAQILKKYKDYNLDDVYFSTFVRQMDNKTQMSSADVVYALSALLESPSHVRKHFIPDIDQEEVEETEEMLHEKQLEMQVENFWVTYDTLSFTDLPTLQFGIDLAKTT